MASKWQQWMPFHIDQFRGSPDVQAMHPVARVGYLYLLASAWQTDDCTIPTDAMDLASLAGLGDELWAQYSPRILRKFSLVDDGKRLQNPVLYEKWLDAKRIFDARCAAAKNTTKIRSSRKKSTVTVENPIGDRTVTDGTPLRSADTITLTGTDTLKTKRQKPSRDKREVLSDPRHQECKEIIKQYWESKNLDFEMTWNGAEGTALADLLSANPKMTHVGFGKLITHRARSECNHSERASKWLRMVVKYANGPLDKYGNPLNGGNKSNGRVENNQNNIADLLYEVRGSSTETRGNDLFPSGGGEQGILPDDGSTTIEGEL